MLPCCVQRRPEAAQQNRQSSPGRGKRKSKADELPPEEKEKQKKGRRVWEVEGQKKGIC